MARSEASQPPKASVFDNMTRAKAEAYGLKIGAQVRQYKVSQDVQNKGKYKMREGTVVQLLNHGFVVQLPTHKTFFRYNLLRRREQGERVEILKG